MIIFQKIRWMNFLSTGNVFTEVQLNRSPSTLIHGENGAGKSTILDALFFSLFGKPYRNINKGQLINSITGKKLLVELEFQIGSKNYLVRRGIKPNIFEIYCDQQLINQDAAARDYQDSFEKNILRMNSKTFGQIVVLGSANYVPFMQLSSAHRREVIEDLLDIQIFSVMHSLLRDKAAYHRGEMTDVEREIGLTEVRLKILKQSAEGLRTNNQSLIDKRQEVVVDGEQEIEKVECEIKQLLDVIGSEQDKVASYDQLSETVQQLTNTSTKLRSSSKSIDREIKFFDSHDNCPTCHQSIGTEFKRSAINSRQENIETLNSKIDEVEKAIDSLKTKLESQQQRIKHIEQMQREISLLNAKASNIRTNITNAQREISSLQKLTDNQEDIARIAEQRQRQTKLKSERKKLLAEKQVIDVALFLLKDGGIKTKIIKQYVPIINKLINKYLATLDFFVNFELDETFSETIKTRYKDEFSYASFSEGEKARLNLAIMFTWRAIAKLRNSAATNLLILDEVFDSSLDAMGNEMLVTILEQIANDSNVFVISHRSEGLQDKFRSIIKFEKHRNFSRIAPGSN